MDHSVGVANDAHLGYPQNARSRSQGGGVASSGERGRRVKSLLDLNQEGKLRSMGP